MMAYGNNRQAGRDIRRDIFKPGKREQAGSRYPADIELMHFAHVAKE